MARIRPGRASSWLCLSCLASPASCSFQAPTAARATASRSSRLLGFPGSGEEGRVRSLRRLFLPPSSAVVAQTRSTAALRMALRSSPGAEGQADIGRREQPEPPTRQRRGEEATGSATALSGETSDDDYLPDGAPWRRLLERSSSLARAARGGNYGQLATVDLGGKPRCRSVVIRGFLALPPDPELERERPLIPGSAWHPTSLACDGLPSVLQMTTDRRSAKVEHALRERSAELVWWFPGSSEQYRIAGQLSFVGGGAGAVDEDPDDPLADASRSPWLQRERQKMWLRISDAARRSFFARSGPGQAFAEGDNLAADKDADEAFDPDGSARIPPPPDSFLLMLLVPDRVDYLRLENMYRQVDAFEDGEWVRRRVNP